MACLQGSLNVTGGFSVSSPVCANPFKDYFIEDVSSLLNFFPIKDCRFSLPKGCPQFHFCPCIGFTYPVLHCLCPQHAPFQRHPLSFKIILYFKWVSFPQIPPSFLAFISPLFSTRSSVKSLLVHLIWRVSSTVEATWY